MPLHRPPTGYPGPRTEDRGQRARKIFPFPKSQVPSPKSALAQVRPALTLVELLLFVALLGLAGSAVLGLLLLTHEIRARQGAIANVEHNGLQLLQFLQHEIRHAERIKDPPTAASGSILTLQSSDSASDPIVVAVQTGRVLLVRRDLEHVLTPREITVTDFRIWNTSPSALLPSVQLSFTLRGTVPLLQTGAYIRTFVSGVTSFPDMETQGNPCGCAPPACINGRYRWFVCESGVCRATMGSITCR